MTLEIHRPPLVISFGHLHNPVRRQNRYQLPHLFFSDAEVKIQNDEVTYERDDP